MSISSRIEAIEQHLTDDYSVLTLAGADLTNVDKNIQNLKTQWEDRLKYYLANGLEVVWNNWNKITGSGTSLSLNNTIEAKMDIVYKGNTSQTGTPTPDNPIPVQVVSGDNTIKVEGKNLVNLSSLTTETSNGITLTPVFEDNKLQYININGTSTALTVFSLTTYTTTTSNVLNGCFGGSSSTYKLDFWTSGYVYANFNNEDTQLPNNSLGTLRIVVYSGKTVNNVKIYPMISTSGGKYQPYQSASYPINLGNIELCKIGDYQDKIAKSTGKNLFDVSTITENTYIEENGNTGSSQVTNLSDYIEVKPNESYTLSYDYLTLLNSNQRNFVYYDENKTFISSYIYMPADKTHAITTPNNAKYIRFSYDKNCYEIMINEGNIALPFEPYGKVWYLNKQIGKVVYNGSESGRWTPSVNGGFTRFAGPYISNAQQIVSRLQMKSNYFHYLSSGDEIGGGFIYAGQFFAYPNQTITTEQNFRDWLSTHNTTIYYVLATPTTTEITDTTLIEQLDNLENAYSYDTQTNISQTNADKPFILDVVALKKLD